MSINEKANLTDFAEIQEKLQNDEVGFLKLSSKLKLLTGINMPINPKNLSLMAGRLSKIMRRHNLHTYKQFLNYLDEFGDGAVTEFIEALTTNKTEFYREPQHFEIMKSELPRILQENFQSGRRELRVWCCASSTGEEPYTILFSIIEGTPNLGQLNLKILASDIDTKVLKAAKLGKYGPQELDGLPPLQITKYFNKLSRDSFQVKSEFRDKIKFAQLNLIDEKYPFENRFDIIFCRNVLIYFERNVAETIIEKLSANLRKGGLLFTGHTETGVTKPKNFETIGVAAYKLLT